MLDRDGAVSAWRRAEGRIYPSVMMNAALYQEYVAVVQGIAEELGDVRSEDDLVVAWHERRDLARMVIDRLAPSMAQLMDRDAVRDAAFCHRHREVTREHGTYQVYRQEMDFTGKSNVITLAPNQEVAGLTLEYAKKGH